MSARTPRGGASCVQTSRRGDEQTRRPADREPTAAHTVLAPCNTYLTLQHTGRYSSHAKTCGAAGLQGSSGLQGSLGPVNAPSKPCATPWLGRYGALASGLHGSGPAANFHVTNVRGNKSGEFSQPRARGVVLLCSFGSTTRTRTPPWEVRRTANQRGTGLDRRWRCFD